MLQALPDAHAAALQQTPSTQKPDTQRSPAVPHSEPLACFGAQVPLLQYASALQSESLVHVDWQAPPEQVNGAHGIAVGLTHAPLPSHVGVPIALVPLQLGAPQVVVGPFA